MTIIINVIGQQIAVKGHKVPLAPHSENFIKLTFSLSSEWKNFKTFAQFRQSNNPPVNVYLDESNSVYVPREIKAGNFTVMLYGAGESIIGTTNCLIFDMVDNCFSADAIETDLTPTLYQQLLNEFKSYLASTKANSESAAASENAAKSYATAADASAQSATTSANNAIAAEKSAKDSATLANAIVAKEVERATAAENKLESEKADKTTATSSADGLMSAADKAKLDGIEAGGNVKSVNGKTGAVTLEKGDVGLGSVDNTKDVDKPISTAMQTALDKKADKTIATASADGLMSKADKAKLDGIEAGSNVKSVNGKTGAVTLSKADVGLGNVDNTKDADKPISTAVQTALDAKANNSVATESTDGLMSAADKAKLDGISSGADGYSPTVTLEEAIIIDEQTGEEETGVEITVTNKTGSTSKTVWNGKQGEQGPKGDKGDKGDTGADGANGKTPVKGTDYWTAADKSAMVSDVLTALPTWNGGSY